MNDRRWRDPRSGRVWEVGACIPAGSSAGRSGEWAVLCFVAAGTPRNGHTIRCCPGVAAAVDGLDDQKLALCLDASAAGGLLWMDPRDRRLWWVRESEGGRGVRFAGLGGEVQARSAGPLDDLPPRALTRILDAAGPATAA